MSTIESIYQRKLIKKLRLMFPGCVILKNDTDYLQGIPDLTILYENMWAILEVKRSSTEICQPNQEWYIEELNAMSFAAFIYPENEGDVLDALQQTFGTTRSSRVSKR